MNVVPGDTVVLARGDAPAHSEQEPLSPGHVDPMESHLSLLRVWQEGRPGEVAGSEGQARVRVFWPLQSGVTILSWG